MNQQDKPPYPLDDPCPRCEEPIGVPMMLSLEDRESTAVCARCFQDHQRYQQADELADQTHLALGRALDAVNEAMTANSNFEPNLALRRPPGGFARQADERCATAIAELQTARAAFRRAAALADEGEWPAVE